MSRYYPYDEDQLVDFEKNALSDTDVSTKTIRRLIDTVRDREQQRDLARAWAKNWHKFARTVYSQFGLLWNAIKGEETIGLRLYYYFLYNGALGRLGKMRAAARKAISICEHGHSELHAVLAMLERSDLPKDETVEQKTVAKLGKRVVDLEDAIKSVLECVGDVENTFKDAGEWYGANVDKLYDAREFAKFILDGAENEDE